MPQVDLETLVRGGSGRKVACETQATTTGGGAAEADADPSSDYPAESYYLSKDELDWFDRNVFFERKASTKGNSGSISISKRYLSLKSKASLIGLGNHRDTNNLRRNGKPAAAKFFLKRSRSCGKSIVPLSEPASPKVSCIGRVRSKKDQNRKLRLQLKKIESEERSKLRTKKTGLWRTLKTKLNLGNRKSQSGKKDAKTSPEEMMATTNDRCKRWVNESVGLGGLKRFTSGRRADSWGGCDVEGDSETEGPVDKECVWSRRGMGSVMEVRCDRDWECVGPASV